MASRGKKTLSDEEIHKILQNDSFMDEEQETCCRGLDTEMSGAEDESEISGFGNVPESEMSKVQNVSESEIREVENVITESSVIDGNNESVPTCSSTVTDNDLVSLERPTARKQVNKRPKFCKVVPDPGSWKKNIASRNYNSGIKRKHKGTVRARKVLGQCRPACRRKCTVKFSMEQQSSLHQSFWGLGIYNRRADFIINNTTIMKVKQKTVENNKRKYSMEYFLPKDGLKVQVCKPYFLKTLDISETTIRYAVENSKDGSSPIVKKVAHNKIKDDVKSFIKQHIESFPTVESHFCRMDSNRKYLETGLNITLMYKLYQEECHTMGKRPAKLCTYRKLFCEKYNFSFYVPKKDQCDTCRIHNLKSLAGSATQHENLLQQAHMRRKVQARECKQQDKMEASETKVSATFDLEQVLTVPKLNVSSAYYLRKLNVYNFTIFNLQAGEGTCFLWTEHEANRGSNEIATALWMWLKEQDKLKKKEVYLYSDTCGGQNRNKQINTMLIRCL